MDAQAIEQLKRPAAYAHAIEGPQLVETHISWVLLTGPYAYKVKKPVDFGFLDFSTLAARKSACEAELTLNRRFSPELYDGLMAVVERDGKLYFAPADDYQGTLVDYAVRMVQFNPQDLFSERLAAGTLDDALWRPLAKQLADSHAALPAEFPTDGAGTPQALADASWENFEQIAPFVAGQPEAARFAVLEQWSRQQWPAVEQQLQTRLTQGHVKDCHGDLHLGNIALIEGAPRFFDCIEFNRGFRVMDTSREIAFLLMDLEARGEQALANRVLNDYLEYSGDHEALSLLAFSKLYYAMVRCKVTLFQLDANDPARREAPQWAAAMAYLTLAEGYVQEARPFS